MNAISEFQRNKKKSSNNIFKACTLFFFFFGHRFTCNIIYGLVNHRLLARRVVGVEFSFEKNKQIKNNYKTTRYLDVIIDFDPRDVTRVSNSV